MQALCLPTWRHLLVMLAVYSCFGTGVAAADNAAARANRIAYDSAIKCAVANSLAGDDRHDAGDDAGATAYKAKSRRSFDLTYALGDKLGYSEKQIAHDLDFAQLSEMPKMMRDKSYFLKTAATCKALKLM